MDPGFRRECGFFSNNARGGLCSALPVAVVRSPVSSWRAASVLDGASAARLADVKNPKTVLRPRGLTAEIVAAIGQVPNSRDADQEDVAPPSAALRTPHLQPATVAIIAPFLQQDAVAPPFRFVRRCRHFHASAISREQCRSRTGI